MTNTSPRAPYTCLKEWKSSDKNDDDNISYLDKADVEAASPLAIVKDASIQLLPEEQRLFQFFEDATVAFEQKMPPFEVVPNEEQPGTFAYKNIDAIECFNLLPKPIVNHTHNIEIRIAGGWVRDKVMNCESHDVDVALDSLSGHQFAIIVQQYLFFKEQQLQDVNKDEDPQKDKNNDHGPNKKKKKRPRITVIAANPSQSKHLETATMTLFGIECDFVHLRGGEVYTADSRIPTLQEDATPLDDALRRDFTVNSLFYNLRKKQVEDWTGRGMSDLIENQLLVTPMDARITFRDDPLRVLRAIRFAVRYGLTLSNEIFQAASSQEVHESLHCKVSRERVGKELGGMLTGKNAKPGVALKLMTQLKLAGCVFEFPRKTSEVQVTGILHGMEYGGRTAQDQSHARENGWSEATELLTFCSSVLPSFTSVGINVDLRVLYLSICLYPCRLLVCRDSKGKEIQLPTFIVKESIKYSNKEINSVTTVLRNVDEMREILRANEENSRDLHNVNPSKFSRLKVGLVLRQLKELWTTAFVVALIAEIHSNSSILQNRGDFDLNSTNINAAILNCVDRAMQLLRSIQDDGLDGCWKVRPLLDGKTLSKTLDLPKGPLIGVYLQELVEWVLMNPDGSKEECELHLKAKRKLDLEEEEKNQAATDFVMEDTER